MMESPPAFAGLEELPSQGDGIDMRPTLLRVLTDLYLQRPTHAPEDERYYTELALRLIDATDVSQRAALAARLARYPSAPRLVVERLARDTIEVAGPILAHSACLTADDLEAIAHACGGIHAEIIARRADWPSTPTPSRAGATAAEASELSELFYAAGPTERRLILINLDYAMLTPSQPLAEIQRPDVWRLESAVLRHNTEAAARELERALGISPAQAHRILNDELGEPTVVAAKAMNFPGDVLPRMLLFMHSRVGQSVDRVHELAELFSEISVDAARRMIAIWRAAAPDDHHYVRQATIGWRTAAENARRALAEVSRRPDLRHDPRLRSSMRREPFRKRHDRENGAPNDLPPR